MIIKDEELLGKYLIKYNFDQYEVLDGEVSMLKAKSLNEAINYILQKRLSEIDKVMSLSEYFEFMNNFQNKMKSFYQ